MVGALLFVVAVLLIIRGRRDMGVWEVSEHTTSQDWLRMLTLLGVLIGYAIVMPFLGYVVSATLLFGATRGRAGRARPAAVFAYGWCVAVLVYLVFDVRHRDLAAQRTVGVLTWTPCRCSSTGSATR